MQIWIPAAAAALVVAGWNAGGAAPPAERYDALVDSTARAAAIQYGFDGTMHYAIAGEEVELLLSGEVRVAWPNAGRMKFVYRPASSEGGPDSAAEEDLASNEFIGNGEGIFHLDHDGRVAAPFGDQWGFLQPEIAPLRSFLARKAVSAASVEEISDETRPGLSGLRCTFEDGETQTLWVDEAGTLRGAQVSSDDGEAKIELDVRIDGWKLSAEADLADYVVPIPEGFTVEEPDDGMADYEADLIAVGDAAPEVTLTGMDDAAFQLSALKGKTIVLNFWFYH